MRIFTPVLVILSALLVPASLMCFAGGLSAEGDAPSLATAKIVDMDGDVLGYVVITEGDLVRLAYNLRGLPPGPHAFHIHEEGACEPPFKSAGGHFNPFGREHGIKNPRGRHAGDLPNISALSDGTSSGVVSEPLVTLKSGKNSLLKEGGTSIVIHAGPDDYLSDPAGEAGPRIACGVIKKE